MQPPEFKFDSSIDGEGEFYVLPVYIDGKHSDLIVKLGQIKEIGTMAKILIVDDSRTSRRMLRNILVENGHEVIGEAENGQIGFEKYIELKPDIVTLDITMPVLDGLGALEKIIAYDASAQAVNDTAAGQKNKMLDGI